MSWAYINFLCRYTNIVTMLRLTKPRPHEFHIGLTTINESTLPPSRDMHTNLIDLTGGYAPELTIKPPLQARSAGVDHIQLNHPAEEKNYTTKQQDVERPAEGSSHGLRDIGQEDIAMCQVIKISDINRALGETPQNVAAAKYFQSDEYDDTNDDIQKQHIAKKSITGNRNFHASRQHHTHTQTVASATEHEVIPTQYKAKSKDLLDEADEIIQQLTPATSRYSTPASTRIAPTQIAADAKTPADVANLISVMPYRELKEKAEELGWNRSVHYSGKGAIPREAYENFINGLGGLLPQRVNFGSGVAPLRAPFALRGGALKAHQQKMIAFGKHLQLDKHKLSNNVLSLQYQNNRKKITGFPNTPIGEALKTAIISTMSGIQPNLSGLSDPEIHLLSRVLKRAKLANVKHPSGMKPPKEDLERLYVNLGSISAGNTSVLLKNQTSKLIDKLVKNGSISTQQAAEITHHFIGV